MRLKPLLLALFASVMLAFAACGGDDGSADATEPGSAEATGQIPIDQRVVTEEDAPGSKPDPVEKPVSVSGPHEFVSDLGDRFVNITPQEVSDFTNSGFVQARHETRYFGDAHSRSAPHIFTLVMEFDSEQGAADGLDTLHADSLRPCPKSCAESAEEFDVDSIPNSHGTHRFATTESIQAAGDTEETPFDLYEIDFADGVFAYRVQLAGPPNTVSQEEAEGIATSLYARVKVAPGQG
jgi:hypothetical protein